MKTDPPGWTDLLRTTAGARLRLSIALRPAWRELLAQRLAERDIALEPLDGAAVEVVRLDADGGLLRASGPSIDIEIELRRDADGCPALRARVRHGAREGSFDVPGLALQRGGSREAWLARTVDGQRTPWLKVDHARDGLGFGVTVFPRAFAAHAGSALQALLPSQVEVLRVRHEG